MTLCLPVIWGADDAVDGDLDIGRARQRLGYGPVVSIGQGLNPLAATKPESRFVDLAGRSA